jgi:hypothetical protein
VILSNVSLDVGFHEIYSSSLNIKDHIKEIISISKLEFSNHFIENTNIIPPHQKSLYQIGFLYTVLIGFVIGQIWLYFNNTSIGKLFSKNVNVLMFKYISIRILNISLFWKLFIFFFCLFIVIDIYEIYFYSGVTNNDGDLVNIVLNMVEDKTKSVVEASPSVVNVQAPVTNINPVTNFNISIETVRASSTAAATVAGVKLGLEFSKSVPTVGGKMATVIGSFIAVQAINLSVNKAVSSSTTDTVTKNNFIPYDTSQIFNDLLNNTPVNEKFSEYPYNLIPDLNMYISLEVSFLVILVNVLLTSYLLEKKIDINKYIKNDKLKKILNFMYNRYISVWSVSRNLIVIWCIFMLFVCIFVSKIILILVLSA